MLGVGGSRAVGIDEAPADFVRVPATTPSKAQNTNPLTSSGDFLFRGVFGALLRVADCSLDGLLPSYLFLLAAFNTVFCIAHM